MKKMTLLLILICFATNSYSQKKKTKKTSKPVSTATILAKADNLSAEIVKNTFYVFINKGTKKDTITIKSVGANLPSDCKITPYLTKNTNLCLVSWTEKAQLQTGSKTEDKTITFSEIYEVLNKTKIFSNTQTSTLITEQVFLDKNKTASQTQQKQRNEGYSLILNKDGDITLYTKKQESKMTFDATKKEYVEARKR